MRHQRSRIRGYDLFVNPVPQTTSRRVIAQWRRLTGGGEVRDNDRPTLIALSGGADSSAIAIVLSRRKAARLVTAHIRHGLRPESEQNRDRDASAELAERLGLPFVTRDIHLPAVGNRESEARRLRYEALSQIAFEMGCRYIATGHHAEDQLETMLMALLRGAGPGGLSGIKPRRSLSNGVTLIRPALACTRAELVAICNAAQWEPVHDETNDDVSRRRAWLRAEVIPQLLRQTDEELPERLMATSRLLRDSQELASTTAIGMVSDAERTPGRIEMSLAPLADQPAVVLGALLRQLANELLGFEHRDALGWKRLSPIIACIQNRGMHTKCFELRGLRISVTNRSLVIKLLGTDQSPDV